MIKKLFSSCRFAALFSSCQLKYVYMMPENNDEYYKQILYSNEYIINSKNDITIKIILTSRFYLFIFIFLILTSQSNALPIPQGKFEESLLCT
jgi:hypothetical protein